MPVKPLYASAAYLFIFFALFLGPPSGWALDPQKKITQYIQDTWKLEEGLPQMSVQTVIRTQQGYLWFGTQCSIQNLYQRKCRQFTQ